MHGWINANECCSTILLGHQEQGMLGLLLGLIEKALANTVLGLPMMDAAITVSVASIPAVMPH